MDLGHQCARCGAELTNQAVQGLCGNCLLALALAPMDSGAGEACVFPNSRTEPIRFRYFGEYELLEEIARGGMGVVFKARQVNLNRLVALKLINSGALASEILIKRFKAEAEAVAALNHPSIVPIYETGEVEGQHYFSMGLIEGPNLHDYLASKPLPVREAAKLITILARAVHHAHQHGILHRDIKPGNIVLDKEGAPYLTDFGLAKITNNEGTLTHTNAIMGTLAYMSPEQARGETKEVTTAADVYGLGAVLYECLTGRPVFASSITYEAIRRVLEDEPASPTSIIPSVDRDLETICLKCLEKNPLRRYASADALANDLDRWSKSEPIQARPSSALERTRKWAKRKPALAALVVVSSSAVLLLIIGLSVSNALITRQQEETTKVNSRLLVEQSQTKDALRREQRVSYYNRIALANRELSVTNLLQADRILAQCPSELRHWEWHYLKRLCNSPGVLILPGHIGRQQAETGTPREAIDQFPEAARGQFPLSEDGRYIVLAAGKSVKLIDALNGDEVRTFSVDQEMVACLAISPDGRLIAAAEGQSSTDMEEGNRVYLWDSTTGAERLSFKGTSNDFANLHFSADGSKLLAVGSIWRGQAPYSKHLMGTEVHGWDTWSGEKTVSFQPPGWNETDSQGRTVRILPAARASALSRDGKQLFLYDEIWELTPPRIIAILRDSFDRKFRSDAGAFTVAFSPDARHVAMGGDRGTVCIYNAGMIHQTFRFFGDRINSVCYSLDGKRIAVGDVHGMIRILDADTGQELQVLKHAWPIAALAFSGEGRYLVTANAAGPQECKVWDLAAPQGFFVLDGHQPPGRSVAFSPDGLCLASRGNDEVVKIWDLSSRQVSTNLQKSAGNSYDEIFESWNHPNLTPVSPNWTRKWPYHSSVATRPDGSGIFVGSDGSDVAVVNAVTGLKLTTLDNDNRGPIHQVAISPDARHAAVIWQGEVMKLWDLMTGRSVAEIPDHDVFWAIAFGPDGERLAVPVGEEVKLFDLQGHEILTLKGEGMGRDGPVFSPDGHRLAVIGGDGKIRVWDATPLQPKPFLQSGTAAQK